MLDQCYLQFTHLIIHLVSVFIHFMITLHLVFRWVGETYEIEHNYNEIEDQQPK